MPIIAGKKYNDVLWEASESLVKAGLSNWLYEIGLPEIYYTKASLEKSVCLQYVRLRRWLQKKLRKAGTSLSKVKISKKVSKKGKFTIVLEG